MMWESISWIFCTELGIRSLDGSFRSHASTIPSLQTIPRLDQPSCNVNTILTYLHASHGVLDLEDSALRVERVDASVVLGSGTVRNGCRTLLGTL